MQVVFIRGTTARKRFDKPRSSWYADIKSGLMTPPVKFGERSSWPLHELDAIAAARIAGQSSDEIRELVKRLQDDRAAFKVAA